MHNIFETDDSNIDKRNKIDVNKTKLKYRKRYLPKSSLRLMELNLDNPSNIDHPNA